MTMQCLLMSFNNLLLQNTTFHDLIQKHIFKTEFFSMCMCMSMDMTFPFFVVKHL